MKLIVAGSRSFNNYSLLSAALDIYQQEQKIDEIISGGANGADGLGKVYAIMNHLPLKVMDADWDKYGKSAGIIRNSQMANYGDALYAFWDGQSVGTKNMISQMKQRNKPYLIYNYNEKKYMKIVILGFTDYNKLNNAMEKLITDSQCYLFTVLCGGRAAAEPSLAEQWAVNVGTPVEKIFNGNVEKLLDEIALSADYVVADLSSDNQFIKRLVMKMKALGKHGTIYR